MNKLLMLKGLPASGKSTRAKELVASGNYIRVNRDLLREMLHDSKWSGKNEDMVVNAEKVLFALGVSEGKNVVVDDTNLNPKVEAMWENAAKEYGVTFEIERIKTPMRECIIRDLKRDRGVGRDVIVGMALQRGLFPVAGKGFVLCDLDGTLCEIEHRRLKLNRPDGTKDWKAFFEDMDKDTLRENVFCIVRQAQSRGHQVFFVSARDEEHRAVTEKWLKDNLPVDFTYEGLFMRPRGDRRDDTIIKQQIYDKYFKEYPIEFVIDDRPKVIRMWRSNGLEVVDVGDGIEF